MEKKKDCNDVIELENGVGNDGRMGDDGGMELLTSFGAQSMDETEVAKPADEVAEREKAAEDSGGAKITEAEAAAMVDDAERETEAAKGTEMAEGTVTMEGKGLAIDDEAVDIDALIAEAEARGYERGRNEGIEAWMHGGSNRRYGDAGKIANDESYPYDNEVMILNNMRPSIWEQ